MDLKVEKYDDLIIESCKTVLHAYTDLNPILEDRKHNSEERGQIDRCLVRMTVASQKIIDLILPLPSSGEIHGLPRESTDAADDPDVLIVDKENQKFDFRPWFAEKTGALKRAIDSLMANLETNPEDVKIHPMADVTAVEHLRGMQKLNMSEILRKAETILEMVESGRISITDVRLDEEDEDCDDEGGGD